MVEVDSLLQVGGMTGVVMLDASEQFLKQKGVSNDMIHTLQNDVFPIVAHYEDLGKLEYVIMLFFASIKSSSFFKKLYHKSFSNAILKLDIFSCIFT